MQETIEVCSDVKAALRHLAKRHKIHVRKIDFEVLGINTFLVRGEDEMQKVGSQALHDIAYASYGMKQFYKVRFFLRGKNALEPFMLSLKGEENETMLYASVSLERLPPLDANFAPLLKNLIQKRMIYEGYVWGLGGKKVDEEIERFMKLLKGSKIDTMGAVRLLLCELRKPEVIALDSLKLLSKSYGTPRLSEISELLEGDIVKVEKGEVLLRYRKPTYKAPWRSCRGEWFGEGEYPLRILKGEGLERLENREQIEYRALETGYASIIEGRLSVLEIPMVESVDFKRSKNIANLGLQKLQILNDENAEDAIGSGAELEIPYLTVKGNVGPSTIRSAMLRINGQIHARASLSAKEATLLFLKGSLKAVLAQVKFCESAHVTADRLRASYVSGTTAFFEEAEVEGLGSNNTLHVGKSLHVGKVLGRENLIFIDPFASKENRARLNRLLSQREFWDEIMRTVSWREKELEKERRGVEIILEELKERELLQQESSVAVARRFRQRRQEINHRLKQCQRLFEKMKESKERSAEIEGRILALKEQVMAISLEFKEGVGEENAFVFKLPNDELLRFVPPKEAKSIRLVKDDEGEFEVRWS